MFKFDLDINKYKNKCNKCCILDCDECSCSDSCVNKNANVDCDKCLHDREV